MIGFRGPDGAGPSTVGCGRRRVGFNNPFPAMAVIQVERKPLTFVERTYLPQVFGGLMTTIRHFFGRRVTLEYPEQRPVISPGYRGEPTLVKDPNGREKSFLPALRVRLPAKASASRRARFRRTRRPRTVEKAPKEFEINMLRCIYCAVPGGLPGGGDRPPERLFAGGLFPRRTGPTTSRSSMSSGERFPTGTSNGTRRMPRPGTASRTPDSTTHG